MTILNMIYGQGNPYQPFHLNGISDLAVAGGNAQATITWTDPGNLVVDGQTLATWSSTKLVRKIGSAPTDSSDGTLVVEETVADTYSVSGYTDAGLTNGTTYYYGAFAVADNGTEIISNIESVTPDNKWRPGANTLVYRKFNGNLDDSSGNNVTLSGTPYGYATGIEGQALQNTNNVQLNSSLIQGNIYSGAFAIAFCINMQNSTTLQRIFAYRGSPSGSVDIQYEFYNDFSGFQVYTNGLSQRIAFPLTNPGIGVWKNMVVTGDGVNQIECYIDGVKTNAYSSYNTTFTYPTKNTAFSIRGSDGANNLLDGVIIENKHWTQSDVDLYLNTYPVS